MSEDKNTYTENEIEKSKVSIDINRDYFQTYFNVTGAISKEFFHSSTAFFQQAIRGVFLLHGACATAIIAHGHIEYFKCMLVVLAFGAMFAVISSALVACSQRDSALRFIKLNAT